MVAKYGVLDTGERILPPEGWTLVKEGELIPRNHRECVSIHVTANGKWGGAVWGMPKNRHSVDAPVVACVYGIVRAYARPC